MTHNTQTQRKHLKRKERKMLKQLLMTIMLSFPAVAICAEEIPEKCKQNTECFKMYRALNWKGDGTPILTATKKCKTNKDCKRMAEAVVYEARGEPFAGGVLVAQVIMSRIEDDRYGDTISQVIHRQGAFSFIKDKKKQKSPEESDWQLAYFVAYYAQQGKWRSRWQYPPTHYWRFDSKAERTLARSGKMKYLGRVGDHKVYYEIPVEKENKG